MSFPRFTVRGFKPPREAVLASLGTLERRTLEEVWHRGEVTVRDVVAAFNDAPPGDGGSGATIVLLRSGRPRPAR